MTQCREAGEVVYGVFCPATQSSCCFIVKGLLQLASWCCWISAPNSIALKQMVYLACFLLPSMCSPVLSRTSPNFVHSCTLSRWPLIALPTEHSKLIDHRNITFVCSLAWLDLSTGLICTFEVKLGSFSCSSIALSCPHKVFVTFTIPIGPHI